MVAHQVDNSGTCTTCQGEANEAEILQCFDCKTFYHGLCNTLVPFCSKTFLASFKKVKSSNFIFVCDSCITKRENQEASNIKDQIAALAVTVNTLASEFKSFKSEKMAQSDAQLAATGSNFGIPPWSNQSRVQKMKASLCIKSNGVPVDMNKVQEIAASNSIQVSKTVVKDNGDVFVDLQTEENREKLTPLLEDETFAGNEVVMIKSKLPTISIRSVSNFTSKEDFIEKVKRQNPHISERIDNGSEFSIVYYKKPNNAENENEGTNNYYQVVARVSEDIRKVIKMNNDKIYMDLVAHHVFDNSI